MFWDMAWFWYMAIYNINFENVKNKDWRRKIALFVDNVLSGTWKFFHFRV